MRNLLQINNLKLFVYLSVFNYVGFKIKIANYVRTN